MQQNTSDSLDEIVDEMTEREVIETIILGCAAAWKYYTDVAANEIATVQEIEAVLTTLAKTHLDRAAEFSTGNISQTHHSTTRLQ